MVLQLLNSLSKILEIASMSGRYKLNIEIMNLIQAYQRFKQFSSSDHVEMLGVMSPRMWSPDMKIFGLVYDPWYGRELQ